jgi:hypothetical protein
VTGPGAEPEELVRAAREALRTGQPYSQWLLIFDNAENPEAIKNLLVDGPGATIITSRIPQWEDLANVLPVNQYARAESIAFLRRRVPNLTDEDRDRLAEDLGDLPLVLEHAAAWLSATKGTADSYLTLYRERPTELLSTIQLSRYPRPIAVTWEISANQLRENAPEAAALVEICAFLGPSPIPLSLFTGAPDGLLPPELQARLHEPTMLPGLLQAVAASALVTVEEGRGGEPVLRQHRMTQALTRDMVSADQAARYTALAHRLLAAAVPRSPADQGSWDRYSKLLPLVLSSGAVTDSAPEVRRMVSNLIQMLINTGEYQTAKQLVDQAKAGWTPQVDPVDRDMVTLAMQEANVLRGFGRLPEAIEVSQACYDQCMERLGAEHGLTSTIASSLAAGQRRIGQMATAAELDQQVWEVRTRVYGPDNEQTLRAAHNVALNLRLADRFNEALEIDRQNSAAFLRTLGPDHRYTLFARNNEARDLRECGDYYGSLALEEEVYTLYLDHLGIDHPETLRAMKNLAISRRKAGRYLEAWEFATEVLERHQRKFGELHVETLAAWTNLANDYLCIGQYAGGLGYAGQAVRGFREILGSEHGLTGCAMTNQAVLIRLSGDPGEALALNQQALAILTPAFGPAHRYTLSCAVNLASDLAAMGQYEAARERDADTYVKLRATSGHDHPYTLSCAVNLALDLRHLNERGNSNELLTDARERYARTLGDGHPEAVAARLRQRANCDIEPPPS